MHVTCEVRPKYQLFHELQRKLRWPITLIGRKFGQKQIVGINSINLDIITISINLDIITIQYTINGLTNYPSLYIKCLNIYLTVLLVNVRKAYTSMV